MALEKFSDIPIRSNGPPFIDASWFNSIRTLLVAVFGDIAGESTQSIGATDTDQFVTAVAGISSQDFSCVDVEYWVRRNDSSGYYYQRGEGTLFYKNGTWEAHGFDQNLRGDDAKITFDVFQETVGGYEEVTLTYSTESLGGTGDSSYLTTRNKKWVI